MRAISTAVVPIAIQIQIDFGAETNHAAYPFAKVQSSSAATLAPIGKTLNLRNIRRMGDSGYPTRTLRRIVGATRSSGVRIP